MSTLDPTRAQVVRTALLTMGWPAAASVSLAVAVGGREVTLPGLLLVACGTMSAYGLDRLVDHRERDPARLRRLLWGCVVLAAVGTGVLACTTWWRFQVCLVLSLISVAYVPLKRFVPKNVMTTVSWTAAIAALPFAEPPPRHAIFQASVATVACIMAANTMLSDLPDIAADRQSGVRGLVPRFGFRAGALAALLFGTLGTLVAGWAERWGLAITALSLALLALRVTRNPGRPWYRLLADGLVTILPGPLALLLG